MKQIISIIAFISLGTSIAVAQQQAYRDSSLSVKYQTVQGRLNGPYASYYHNGKKKAQGRFDNNCRTGEWFVWDTTGKLLVKRTYTGPFAFKQSTINPNSKFSQPLIQQLTYNKEGFIDYYPLAPGAISLEKRVWRELNPADNPLLFKDNRLFKILIENAGSGSLVTFADDKFETPKDPPQDMTKYEVVAFKTKEDWFYDKNRQLAECRVIGLCPVAVNKQNGAVEDLYWVYFPRLRPFLAPVKVVLPAKVSRVKTLDDLFFFSYYHGDIYKEDNARDRSISAYASGEAAKRESQRIDLQLVEMEHHLWANQR